MVGVGLEMSAIVSKNSIAGNILPLAIPMNPYKDNSPKVINKSSPKP